MRMATIAVTLLALVALSGLVLAAPFGVSVTAGEDTNVPAPGAPVAVRAHVEMNVHGEVNGPVAVRTREEIRHGMEHGERAQVAVAHTEMRQYSDRAREMLEKVMRARGMSPREIQKHIERYMRMGREAMERARQMVLHSAEIRKRYEHMAQAYMRVNDVIAKTAHQFHLAEERWLQVRKMYLRGEVNDQVYLSATKEFLLTAIQATAERVKAFEQVSTDLNVNATVNADLNKLLQLAQEVNAAQSIDEIRAIYPEIRELIQKINRETVLKDYAQLTVMYGESITIQLQVAAARLTAISTELNAEGKLDQNTQATIEGIFAQIAQVQDEFNKLKLELQEGNIDTATFLKSVAELRAQIREIYKEIVDLYRQMLRYRVEARIHTQARAHIEANATPAAAGGAEVNASATAEVNATEENNVAVENTEEVNE